MNKYRYEYCMEVFKDSKYSEELKQKAHNIWEEYQEKEKNNNDKRFGEYRNT